MWYCDIVISISCRNPALYANNSVSNEVSWSELSTAYLIQKKTSQVVVHFMQAQPVSNVLDHAFYLSQFKFPVYSLFL